MAIIYHVTGRSEWEAAQSKGFYEAPSLHSEGFIHCSEEGQVAGVLSRYFSGRKDLVRLTINTDKLKSTLRYEQAPSIGEDFPHIYGPLNISAVEKIEEIHS